MKLSDFLFNIGRPVAFYPGLVKALGSMKQAVFICQMAYWKDKGSDPDGWIYKTSEEIETETSLTYKEQITVRAALVEKGTLQERYARTEHQMYFRVDWDVVNAIWDEHLTNGHMPKGKVAPDQKSTGILPEVISLNSNTYITTENTTETERSEAADAEVFNALSEMTGGGLNSNTPKFVDAWKERHTIAWILKAIGIARENKARSVKYVDEILIGWEAKGYPKTREERVSEKRSKNQAVKPENNNQAIIRKVALDASRYVR
jgi:DnaD/phage-associated family protein